MVKGPRGYQDLSNSECRIIDVRDVRLREISFVVKRERAQTHS